MKLACLPRHTTIEINPVLLKEIRGRMRGVRAFILLTANLALLAFFTGLFYLAQRPSMDTPFGPTPAEVGWNLFVAIALMQFLIVLFGVPSLAANTISGEYENQTYEMLLTTPLSARSIVLGKLFATLAYVVITLLSALPLYSLVYVLGGFRWTDVFKANVGMLFLATLFSIIAMYNSAWLRRTVRASGLSYFLIGGWTAFPYVFAVFESILNEASPLRFWFFFSPFSFYLSLLAASENSVLHAFGGQTSTQTPTWQLSIFLFVAVAAVFFILTTRLVLPEARRAPRSRTFIMIALVFVAVTIAAVLVHPPSVWKTLFERSSF